MEFKDLLRLVGDEPVFESSLLLAGDVKPENVRLQLARWRKSGRIYQLRRGLYMLGHPYQKVKPHPFLIANRLQRASYISLQTGLAHYGLIPDIVHVIQSVTAGRPERLETPSGVFEFRHIKPALLQGYRMTNLGNNQQALVATPEKALLDLIYLTAGGDEPEYLQELRLQNLDLLSLDDLRYTSAALNSPKLHRAVEVVEQLIKREDQDYEDL